MWVGLLLMIFLLRCEAATDPKEGSDRRAQWIEVGAVWPHKNGQGFDLVIPAGISLSGRIVCRERKEQPAE